MPSRTRHRDDATFDLTPMIDVVLLLIIFFMMTTQFARSQHTDMNLPEESGESTPEDAARTIFLDLGKDGSISLLGRQVAMSDAAEAVRAASVIGPGGASIRVVVRADRDCPAAAFSALCASLSKSGINSVSLGTAAPAEGGAR